jgi:hypothetical protein
MYLLLQKANTLREVFWTLHTKLQLDVSWSVACTVCYQAVPINLECISTSVCSFFCLRSKRSKTSLIRTYSERTFVQISESPYC